jgi:hypothetical protein
MLTEGILAYIHTYTSHLRPGPDQLWPEEIKPHLSQTWSTSLSSLDFAI